MAIGKKKLILAERLNKVRLVWEDILTPQSKEKLRKIERMAPPLISPRDCIRILTKNNAIKAARLNKLIDDLFADLTSERHQNQSEQDIQKVIKKYQSAIEQYVRLNATTALTNQF